jgi:hypothetical protein
MLIDHRDGFTANRNNFYLYFDPANAGRAVFVPWGADDIFADARDGEARRGPADYLFAELPRRLSRIPSIRARFERRMTELLDTVWDEPALLQGIDRYARRVRKLRDPDYEKRLDELRVWIDRYAQSSVRRWLRACRMGPTKRRLALPSGSRRASRKSNAWRMGSGRIPSFGEGAREGSLSSPSMNAAEPPV